MMMAVAMALDGSGRMRSLTLPALAAACRAGINTATACTVTKASKVTAIAKGRKSNSRQNVRTEMMSKMKSMATPPYCRGLGDAMPNWRAIIERGEPDDNFEKVAVSGVVDPALGFPPPPATAGRCAWPLCALSIFGRVMISGQKRHTDRRSRKEQLRSTKREVERAVPHSA